MNEGEKKVVGRMIAIYCRANHHPVIGLCDECKALSDYAIKRLENCPFGENKPTCESCSVHCYKSDMRERIRTVMRYAGPRMLFIHPIDTVKHLYQEYKRSKTYKASLK